MAATDITGYTADADVYCVLCAAERYPAACTSCGAPGKLSDPGWHRDCPKPADHGYFRALDSEGNEVHPFFGSDEFGGHCAGCGSFVGRRIDDEAA